MTPKEFFRLEWGTGFHKAVLHEEDGLLELSMEDIYNTMENYVNHKTNANKTSKNSDKS